MALIRSDKQANLDALAKEATVSSIKDIVSADLAIGGTLTLDDSTPLNIDKSNLATSTAQEAQRLLLENAATESKLEQVRSALAGTLTVQQASNDVIRLRALEPRKTASITASTTASTIVLAAPDNAAHRHVVCWLRVQNASATDTTVTLTGNGGDLSIICPAKGSGSELSASPELFTLPSGQGLAVSLSVSASVVISCGYITVAASGVPI
jgi:hypothetical protein